MKFKRAISPRTWGLILGYAVIASFLLGGCETSTSNSRNVGKAGGEFGEIILVMDSLHWESPLGIEIKKTYRATMEVLPRPEPEFKVRYIRPGDFNQVLKMAKNVVIVAVLDNYSSGSERVKNYFTNESLKRISSEPDLWLLTQKDLWARGQEVLYLFGRTEEELSKHISDNRSQLKAHFNNIEKRRLEAGLYKAKEMKELSSVMLANHDFSLRIPFGWKIAFQESGHNFIWIRNPGLEIDKNIWVYYEDYTSKDQLNDVVSFRNRVTQEYIYDDKEKNDTSFVVVESKNAPVLIQEVNFKGKYAKEVRGLWKTKNLSMGGPFLGYMLIDEELGRIFYIDGFVYSPGKPQRETMRELEIILWTFQTRSDVKAEADPTG